MKFFALLPILATVLAVAQSAHAADTYRFYTNARFGYRIQYPSNLVAPAPETDNGGGRKFRSRNGKIVLTTYGRNNISKRTLRGELARAVRDWRADGGRITLQRATKGWFVISGYVGDDIFYEKTVLHQGAFCTLIWEYPRALKTRLDAPVTRAFTAFAPQNFRRGLGSQKVVAPSRVSTKAKTVVVTRLKASSTTSSAPPRASTKNGY